MQFGQLQMDYNIGVARKHRGIKKALSHNDYVVEQLREVAKRISREKGFVTIDEVRVYARANGLEPDTEKVWGGLLRGKGWTYLERVGSENTKNNGRKIWVMKWEGKVESTQNI